MAPASKKHNRRVIYVYTQFEPVRGGRFTTQPGGIEDSRSPRRVVSEGSTGTCHFPDFVSAACGSLASVSVERSCKSAEDQRGEVRYMQDSGAPAATTIAAADPHRNVAQVSKSGCLAPLGDRAGHRVDSVILQEALFGNVIRRFRTVRIVRRRRRE